MSNQCSSCGIALERINYVMPNYRPVIEDGELRPPLCKECWQKEIDKRQEEIRS